MTFHRFLPFARNCRCAGWVLLYCGLSSAIPTAVLAEPPFVPAVPPSVAPTSASAMANALPPSPPTASHRETGDRAQDTGDQDTGETDTSQRTNSDRETSDRETSDRATGDRATGDRETSGGETGDRATNVDGIGPPNPLEPAMVAPAAAPLDSRERAVRAIRFAVVVVATLLAMLSTVALLKINRWTHGKYMGRLWWVGVVLVVSWLLAGWLWAWNNDFWANWLDGPLL